MNFWIKDGHLSLCVLYVGIESLAIQYSCEVRPKCSRFMSLPSCEMVRLVYLTSGIGKVSWREVDVDWVFGLPHEYSMSLLLVQSRIKLHQCTTTRKLLLTASKSSCQ